jgi:Kef-type K+ transport system membrane component KefB
VTGNFYMLAATATGVHETERLVFFTLLQLIIIILGARLAGQAAWALGQPRVVGEIIGGLLLGRSFFGRLFPGTFEWVFQLQTAEIGTPLVILSQIGLILLMFQIGMEFDFDHLREMQNRNAVIAVSLAGIVAPFALGLTVGWWSWPQLAAGTDRWSYQLFMAVALSITAIPILGRIMMEFALTRTRLGAIAISSAAINDVAGWMLLAVISQLTTAGFSAPAFSGRLALLAVYFAGCWWVARPLLGRLLERFPARNGHLPHTLLALLLGMIFLSGLVTYKLGIFAIFGGFMMGVLLYDRHEFVAAWKRTVGDFVAVFFLPIFFTFTGLRTNVGALDSAGLWGWCAVILGAAVLGKYGGCLAAARLTGLGWAESHCMGVMMNTRALMELVVVNIGYELGVIPPSVFTMLVLMAIISTVMTAPLLRLFLPRAGHTIPARVSH